MIIIVLKFCVICGTEFEATGRGTTCGEKCADIRNKRNKLIYNPEYYRKNWIKWQQYAKDAKKEKIGTTNLMGEMHKNEDGSTDFEGEINLIKKEMVRLGLRYEK